jgi:integrase
LFRVYQAELPVGAKEERTLEGERLHVKNILRHLKPTTAISTVTTGTVQHYVEFRSKDEFRGRAVGPDTIKKELSTLRLVWNWAKQQGYLDASPPVDRIVYPKRDEKPPFMTMAEITRRLKSKSEEERNKSELWEALYLTRREVDQLLVVVSSQQVEPFVYPLFVLVAHTGMRRSELIRAEASDFDFEARTVLVREKKRSRKHALSFRRIPMTALVERVFRKHFAEFPPERYAFHRPGEPLLSEDTATNHFKAALRDTSWENVRGFHVLRHSFASNAAAEGVDQRMIDEWMGHQTEEMRRRYRHLTPSKQQAAMDAVFGE